MATVLPDTRRAPDLDPEVLHPLDRIRGTVRRYVITEGVLSAAIFVVVWFGLALLFDYGVYAAFRWDWVASAPAGLRIAGLVLAAILTFRVIRLLTKELSYPALALVLEKRFPKVLGDRLITAVELSDVSAAAKHGYSAEMVRKTIAEARQRVGTVPVREVFNWRRLWFLAWMLGFAVIAILAAAVAAFLFGPILQRQDLTTRALAFSAGGLVALGLFGGLVLICLGRTPPPRAGRAIGWSALVLGLLAVGGLGYAAVDRSASGPRFGWRLAHVSGTVLGRDVLLDNVFWPPRTYIEVVEYPRRVPRGTTPTVRVRAVRWMVADPAAEFGWRPMLWSDLATPTVGLSGAPAEPFEGFDQVEGVSLREARALTVDDAEALAAEVTDKVKAVRETLDTLGAQAPTLVKQGRVGRTDEGASTPDFAQWSVRMWPGMWRPLAWGDLRTEKVRDARGREVRVGGLLGLDVLPEVPAAHRAGQPTGTQPEQWSVARVAAHIEALEKGGAAVRESLDRLAALADDPSTGRRLLRLDTPGQITLHYAPVNGGAAFTHIPLTPKRNNIYEGKLQEKSPEGKEGGLTQDTGFHASADDVSTDSKVVGVVELPKFAALSVTQYQPAYLYHGPPREGYDRDHPLYQTMPRQDLPLTGDVVMSVPAGTGLVLTGTADSPLRAAYARPVLGLIPGARPGRQDLVPLPLADDGRTITIDLRGNYRLAGDRTIDHRVTAGGVDEVIHGLYIEPLRINNTLAFDLVLEREGDEHIRSERAVRIQIAEDRAPDVAVRIDGVRRATGVPGMAFGGEFFVVTPTARIPFLPESTIKDDFGLSKVEFEFAYWQENPAALMAARAQLQTRGLLFAPAVGPALLPGGTVPAVLGSAAREVDEKEKGTVAVPAFTDRAPRFEPISREELAKKVREELKNRAPVWVKLVELNDPVRRDFFDLQALRLPVQPGFRFDLNLAAYDTNFDTGPRVGRLQVGGRDAPIAFRIVSEADLLALIGNEELGQIDPLDKAIAQVSEARRQYGFLSQKNKARTVKDNKPVVNDVRNALVAGKVSVDFLRESGKKAMEVLRVYRRLSRECLINRVNDEASDHYGDITLKLEKLQLPAERKLLSYAKVEEELRKVLQVLADEKWADPDEVAAVGASLDALYNELQGIRKSLGDELDEKQAAAVLRAVIQNKELLQRQMRDWRIRYEGAILSPDPEIRPTAPLFLAKGESKKVKHALDWRQYAKDDLKVKVEVSDKEGVIAPTELKLNVDDNLVDFTYEIRAGQKAGDFKITLTPEVGKPVVVAVNVK